MRRIIALGGGDMREKTTLKIDEYVANLAKERAGEKRAYGLYIGTASHDFMPAFNTFRKTYTSVFDIKADCLLIVNMDTPEEKINEKFSKADFIYVGGGDTLFMLETWKKKGILQKLKEAYLRGVILVGRSAGAVCWFKQMFTDSEIMNGKSEEYKLYDGLNYLEGTFCPHYNLRKDDFIKVVNEKGLKLSYGVEDDSAIVFENEKFVKAISSGGSSYKLEFKNENLQIEKL